MHLLCPALREQQELREQLRVRVLLQELREQLRVQELLRVRIRERLRLLPQW